MSDNVLIALIIAVAVATVCGIAIFVLKDKVRSGKIEVSKDGIRGVKIKGDENDLTATNGGQIDKADIEGNRNRLNS